MEPKFRVGDRVRVQIYKLDPKTQTRYKAFGFGAIYSVHTDFKSGFMYRVGDKHNKMFTTCFEDDMAWATEIDELLYG